MGNSTTKGMPKQTVSYAPESVLMKHINGFVKTLMTEKTEELFHNKNSCKNIHMILEDRILNAVSKNDLIGLRSDGINLIIGYEYFDPKKLDTVCSHFKKYYLKKLELVITIGTLEDIINTKIFYLTKREFCLTEDEKRTEPSDITITESSAWKRGINKKPYSMPGVYAENIKKRNSRDNILKSVPNVKTGSENYFISELDNPEDCIRNKGFWATSEILEEKGRIPIPNLVDYRGQMVNTVWFNLYNNLLNQLNVMHKKIEEMFGRICIITNVSGTDASGRDFTYKESDITDLDMQNITNELMNIITIDLMNIEKSYLELIFTKFETRKSIQELESTELKRKSLEQSVITSTGQNIQQPPQFGMPSPQRPPQFGMPSHQAIPYGMPPQSPQQFGMPSPQRPPQYGMPSPQAVPYGMQPQSPQQFGMPSPQRPPQSPQQYGMPPGGQGTYGTLMTPIR